MSPLLFLVYINDLVVNLGEGVKVSAFADDLAVWQSGRDIVKLVEGVQRGADTVSGWCKEWLMQISVKKCSHGWCHSGDQ